MTAISGLIQQKYGHKKEEAHEKVSTLFQKYISDPARNAFGDTSPKEPNTTIDPLIKK